MFDNGVTNCHCNNSAEQADGRHSCAPGGRQNPDPGSLPAPDVVAVDPLRSNHVSSVHCDKWHTPSSETAHPARVSERSVPAQRALRAATALSFSAGPAPETSREVGWSDRA